MIDSWALILTGWAGGYRSGTSIPIDSTKRRLWNQMTLPVKDGTSRFQDITVQWKPRIFTFDDFDFLQCQWQYENDRWKKVWLWNIYKTVFCSNVTILHQNQRIFKTWVDLFTCFYQQFTVFTLPVCFMWYIRHDITKAAETRFVNSSAGTRKH